MTAQKPKKKKTVIEDGTLTINVDAIIGVSDVYTMGEDGKPSGTIDPNRCKVHTTGGLECEVNRPRKTVLSAMKNEGVFTRQMHVKFTQSI